MKRRGYPTNVSETKDRHGKYRLRYRTKGKKPYYFKAAFGTPAFEIELTQCREGKIEAVEPTARYARGTIGDLIARYLDSTSFKGGGAMTQRKNRGILDRFRDTVDSKGKTYGHKFVETMTFEAVDRILANKGERHPAAANNLRKQLRRLFEYAVKLKIRPDNPVEQVEFRGKPSDGHHAWTEGEIAKYRAQHKLGTNARLSMELMLWTGQRRSDAVKMGKKDIQAGRVALRQEKTGKNLRVKVSPQLRAAIDAMTVTGLDTFLVTQYGKPYTSNGIGNAFKKWCREAGIPHCNTHGLRKAMARRGAELGGTNQQLKAVGGWSKDDEVSIYTASASQPELADSIIDRVSAWEANLLSNPNPDAEKTAEKGK